MADKILTIAQVSPEIEGNFQCIEDRRDEFELPALFELEGAMKLRIHTDGLDSENQKLGLKNRRGGLYSKGYEKLKSEGGKIGGRSFSGAGSNVYPINLFVFGDLARGYSTGKKGGSSVIAFNSTDAHDKAIYAENNYNTEIFKPTETELQDMEAVLKQGIDEVLKSCFK